MKTPVLIATPLREWTSPEESLSPHLRRLLTALARLNCEWSFDFACYAGGNVARGRNKLVAAALRSSVRYIIFLDDDIEPTPEDILCILSHRKHVVGGLYTTREEDGKFVLNVFREAKIDPKNGLLPIGEIGCGFKCYHRSVFEYLIKNEPALAYISDEDGNTEWGFFSMGVMEVDGKRRWLSEDYWLDQLCRKHGIPVYADTGARVKHRDQKTKIAYPPGNNWPEIPAPREPPTPPVLAEELPATVLPGTFLIIVQYWWGDQEHALRLFKFLRQLHPGFVKNIHMELIESEAGAGYPEGPNLMATGIMSNMGNGNTNIKAVLLLESDCVPLAADWIEQLSAEWDRASAAGKLILGSWRAEGGPFGHINGCMIFDPSLSKRVNLQPIPTKTPWDIHYAKAFSDHWARTGLIANRYKEVCVTEEQLRTPECGTRPPVLVHGVKDDSAWNIAQKLLQRETPSLHIVV